MSREMSRAGIAFAACLSAIFFSTPAPGDERKLVASLGVKEEHNDNLFFETAEENSSYVTTISPALELIDRTERLDAALTAGAHWLFYSAEDDLDAVDQAYRGKLAYRISPSLRLTADAAFRRDTRPDREIETTGLFVTFRSDRQNYAAGVETALGEKTAANLSYAYEKNDYDTSAQIDSRTHIGTLVFIHDLGQHFEETKGRAVFGYARSEFIGITLENLTAALGMSRGLTEVWSVQADVGGRYTRSEFDVQRLEFVPPSSLELVSSTEADDDYGWIANVALSYRGEKNRGSLSFYRDVVAASGRQGASERNALVLNVTHRFTYEFSGSLAAGYYTNRSEAGEFSSQEIDERTVRLRPSMRYDFTNKIFGETAYQYTRVLYGQTDTEAAQNLIYLQLGMQYPIYE